jgi:hypothetical protein
MPSEESGFQLVNSICPVGTNENAALHNGDYKTYVQTSSESSIILKCVNVYVYVVDNLSVIFIRV